MIGELNSFLSILIHISSLCILEHVRRKSIREKEDRVKGRLAVYLQNVFLTLKKQLERNNNSSVNQSVYADLRFLSLKNYAGYDENGVNVVKMPNLLFF